jgi:death-on-curing protein
VNELPLEPLFFEERHILSIHKDQIDKYLPEDGQPDYTIISQDALSSCIAQPSLELSHGWAYPTLFDMAAAYLYFFARNHAFIQGNKRVAAATAILFLKMNGVRIEMSQEDLQEITTAVAEKRCEREEVAEFLRNAPMEFEA